MIHGIRNLPVVVIKDPFNLRYRIVSADLKNETVTLAIAGTEGKALTTYSWKDVEYESKDRPATPPLSALDRRWTFENERREQPMPTEEQVAESVKEEIELLRGVYDVKDGVK
jgi:hypothetical protein